MNPIFAQAGGAGALDTTNVAADTAGLAEQVMTNPTGLLNKLIEFLSTQGVTFALNLIGAIAIFVIGRWVARFIVGVVTRLMKKGGVEGTLTRFLTNLMHAILMVVVVIAALDQLGIDTTSFAAILAAAGLAVGFALQGSLANFAAGVMIILFKPFKAGDLVEVGGSTGIVKHIEIFNTTMLTLDNVTIIVPNGAISGNTITNFSAQPIRRVDMVMGCGYGDDIKKAQRVLMEILTSDERILQDPAPAVSVAALADSSVNFNVRPWCKGADYWAVYSHVHEQVYIRFEQEGLSIPFPQQDVHIQTMPGAGAAAS